MKVEKCKCGKWKLCYGEEPDKSLPKCYHCYEYYIKNKKE